ncbi:hypothetical protein P7C71_g6601, partial [Lecanoromycetidae sp. Uapishka_2]
MIFGNLVIVKGSVPSVHKIKIAFRTITFGRALESTYIHQNSLDNRIPKNAIDVMMWYPNIEKDIAAGKDWATNKNLRALISTRTNRYIKVNGIRLMRGVNCWLYGELKSGDVISVFELSEGRKAEVPEDNEFLKFRCEFYVGASRDARKEGNPFKVLKEEEKYNQMVARKSRESSEAVDLLPTPANAGAKGSVAAVAKKA